jgi:hypothetical protein
MRPDRRNEDTTLRRQCGGRYAATFARLAIFATVARLQPMVS